jgi:hypothetical protein
MGLCKFCNIEFPFESLCDICSTECCIHCLTDPSQLIIRGDPLRCPDCRAREREISKIASERMTCPCGTMVNPVKKRLCLECRHPICRNCDPLCNKHAFTCKGCPGKRYQKKDIRKCSYCREWRCCLNPECDYTIASRSPGYICDYCNQPSIFTRISIPSISFRKWVGCFVILIYISIFFLKK